MPEHVKKGLKAKTFKKKAESQFKQLDKDGNGLLDAEELFPLLQEMSAGQVVQYALPDSQVKFHC